MSGIETWDDMEFWTTEHWEKIQENLDELDRKKVIYCPRRENLFAALDATPYADTKICMMGQDPYPNPMYSTGLAFSIPKDVKTIPPTLTSIFKEYNNDLTSAYISEFGRGLKAHYPFPKSGSLLPWAKQGVLLWNSIPTCEQFKSLSHFEWYEWHHLTIEIIKQLSEKHIVFIMLGAIARKFIPYIGEDNYIIQTSHPSPRGSLNSNSPFIGSRIFTRANDALSDKGFSPVDWRL